MFLKNIKTSKQTSYTSYNNMLEKYSWKNIIVKIKMNFVLGVLHFVISMKKSLYSNEVNSLTTYVETSQNLHTFQFFILEFPQNVTLATF